jgi:hypothetical protein
MKSVALVMFVASGLGAVGPMILADHLGLRYSANIWESLLPLMAVLVLPVFLRWGRANPALKRWATGGLVGIFTLFFSFVLAISVASLALALLNAPAWLLVVLLLPLAALGAVLWGAESAHQ